MKLSNLQKFILRSSYVGENKKVGRRKFLDFYRNFKELPSLKDRVNVITKSLERLIDKDLLVGFGERTKHKWFITEVRLTRKGRVLGKKLLGEQQELPFRKKTKPNP